MKTVEQYLEAGKIVNTHGVRGDIKIESWCDSPEVLAGMKTLYLKQKDAFLPLTFTKTSIHKGRVLAKIEGCDTIEQAMLYKNKVVYALREDIPVDENAIFVSDLFGLPVIDVDSGLVYGTLKDVFETAASDIYTVETPNGEVLIPAVDEFIKEIDAEKGIFIRPIQGMFDDAL